jgi:hypothetical protein
MSRPILELELDSVSIMRLRSAPDQEAADALTTRLRALERAYKRGYIERGLILLEVEERELWRLVEDPETGQPFTSLERWIVSCATHSRSDCFAALKAVKELRDIPTDQLLDTPRVNVSVLQSLSKSVRKRPEVIKAAQSMSNREFVKTLERDHPNQHIEERRTIHLNPVKGATAIIEEAIAMCMVLEDLKTREDALEYMAAEYVDTNRRRFEQVQKEMA